MLTGCWRGEGLTGVVAGAGVGDHDHHTGILIIAHTGALQLLTIAVLEVEVLALHLLALAVECREEVFDV